MTTDIAKRTWLDLANSVATEFGVTLTVNEAEHLLWNHTGFPCFWQGDGEACARSQLWNFFVARSYGCVPCSRCGADAAGDLCVRCELALAAL